MNSYFMFIVVEIIIQLFAVILASPISVENSKGVLQCKCGVVAFGFRSIGNITERLKQVDHKIVNGQIMKANGHPHLALLMRKDHKQKFVHVCGGTIINNKYILTAAHCFGETRRELLGVRKSDWQVRLGVHNKFMRKEGKVFSISEIITHRNYRKVGDSGGLDNDITLLKLNDTIPYTEFIRPACLPTPEPHEETIGTVQGWGKTESGHGSSRARKAILRILSDEDCVKSNIGPTMGEPDTKICAEDTTADACQGDSGGPLFIEIDLKTIVVGIVSSGKDCGDFNYPGVYTKVEKFLTWIQEHTKDAEYCS